MEDAENDWEEGEGWVLLPESRKGNLALGTEHSFLQRVHAGTLQLVAKIACLNRTHFIYLHFLQLICVRLQCLAGFSTLQLCQCPVSTSWWSVCLLCISNCSSAHILCTGHLTVVSTSKVHACSACEASLLFFVWPASVSHMHLLNVDCGGRRLTFGGFCWVSRKKEEGTLLMRVKRCLDAVWGLLWFRGRCAGLMGKLLVARERWGERAKKKQTRVSGSMYRWAKQYQTSAENELENRNRRFWLCNWSGTDERRVHGCMQWVAVERNWFVQGLRPTCNPQHKLLHCFFFGGGGSYGHLPRLEGILSLLFQPSQQWVFVILESQTGAVFAYSMMNPTASLCLSPHPPSTA